MVLVGRIWTRGRRRGGHGRQIRRFFPPLRDSSQRQGVVMINGQSSSPGPGNRRTPWLTALQLRTHARPGSTRREAPSVRHPDLVLDAQGVAPRGPGCLPALQSPRLVTRGGGGMVATDLVNFLFADPRSLYDDAPEMLDQGKIRNAAEKVWGATKRATDALVLAREGEEPQPAGQARRAPTVAERPGLRLRHVPGPINTKSALLHVNCGPEEEMSGLIQATISACPGNARSCSCRQWACHIHGSRREWPRGHRSRPCL